MKKSQKLLRAIVGVTPVAALAVFANTASATVDFYDSFNYPTGTITSAPSTPWTHVTGSGTDQQIVSGSLSYPGLATGSDNSVQFDGTTGSANVVRRNLSTTYATAGSTIYYSVTLNIPSIAANEWTTNSTNWTNGSFMLGFSKETSGTSITAAAPLLIRPSPAGASSTNFNLGIGVDSANASRSWSGSILNTATTYFLVGSYTFNSGSATNDVAKLWINPTPGSLEGANAASVTTTAASSQSDIASIAAFFLRNNAVEPQNPLFDDLRVGTSWADVTPSSAGTPTTLYWDTDGITPGAGGTAPSGTWDNTTQNWSGDPTGSSSTVYSWPTTPGDNAVFSAGAAATSAYTITVVGTQNAASLTFQDNSPTVTGGVINLGGPVIVSTGVTATIDSVISGSTGLPLQGAGTLVITGSANNYTGATTIASGTTLQLGAGGTVGSLPAASAITDSGTISFNRSNDATEGTDFAAGISGSGGITQAGGAGSHLILNAPNTLTGVTKATSGIISITDAHALQASTVDTSGAGTIDFGSLTAVTVGGLNGSNPYTGGDANGMAITFAGTLRESTYSAPITGSNGSITMNGTGAAYQHLASSGNNYAGGTTINSGILQFDRTDAMPASGTVTVNSGGTLSVRAGGTAVPEWTNSTNTTTPGTIGSLIAGKGGQGAPVVWNDGSSMGISTLTATGGALTYSGVIGSFQGASGTTNHVGLFKTGSGTNLTLTAANTFDGPITLDNDGGIISFGDGTNAGTALSAGHYPGGATIPTLTVGNAGGTASVTDGSKDTGIHVLTSNALPSDTLISSGSSVNGSDAPSALLQLYDGFVSGSTVWNSTVEAAHPSSNTSLTIRGIKGGNMRVKTGLGTLTIDVPTGESYSSTGVLITRDEGDNIHHGTIIKTGGGEQDFNQATTFDGEFILQQGTIGIGNSNTFGTSATSTVTVEGGTMKNIVGGSLSLAANNFNIAGSFTVDTNGGSDTAIPNNVITITTPNPTITVLGDNDNSTGKFVWTSKIVDNGNGFTKAGPGILNFTGVNSTANNVTGPITVQAGSLRVTNTTGPGGTSLNGLGSGDVTLTGGQLEFNGSQSTLPADSGIRTMTLTNPMHVGADNVQNTSGGTIAYNSTTPSLTDTTDPAGVIFDFTSDTFDWTAGTLTLTHKGTSTGITFRPRFSGNSTYAGPVSITNGASPRKTVMESDNTGTQTWSNTVSGTGSYSRLSGGTTVFGNSLLLTGASSTVSVANNSSIVLAESAGNNNVMRAPTLSIGTTSSNVDVKNNKMILPGATLGASNGNGTGYAAGSVLQMVHDGRNGGTWNGNGIITSESNADNAHQYTSLGVAKVSDLGAVTGATKTTFGGQSVAGTDVLVMYTWNGDANLDGKVNADDYFQIDSHYNKPTSGGWLNGDFNYDGVINGDDYFLIDQGFHNQGAAIASAPGLGGASLAGVSAVPEPASFGIMAMAAALGLRRRRKH